MYTSNALVNSYYEANFHSDHKYNCAWGAGADCTCGLWEEEARASHEEYLREEKRLAQPLATPHWGVLVSLGKTRKDWFVHVGPDFERAVTVAKAHAKGGWKNVRTRRVSTVDQLETAEFCIEKLEDWQSD